MNEFDIDPYEFAENNNDLEDNFVKRSLYICHLILSYYLIAQTIIKLLLVVGAAVLFCTLAALIMKTKANITEGKIAYSAEVKKHRKLMKKREDGLRKDAAKQAMKDLDVIEQVKETQRRKMLKKELPKKKITHRKLTASESKSISIA